MSSPTIAPPASRLVMHARIAFGAAAGLPVPHSQTLTGPTAERGQATLWLDNGDTTGVERWAAALVESGAVAITEPGYDRTGGKHRRYPATGGRGSYRIYRAELDLDGWRVAIGCQVIP